MGAKERAERSLRAGLSPLALDGYKSGIKRNLLSWVSCFKQARRLWRWRGAMASTLDGELSTTVGRRKNQSSTSSPVENSAEQSIAPQNFC